METEPATPRPASLFEQFNDWLRTSTMLKICVIGFLVLLLLIPTSMLQSLINEREQTRDMAVREVSEKWGNVQTIAGPVLSVPVRSVSKDDKGKETVSVYYANFLPDKLDIDGSVRPEQRHRGIYNVMLYNTRLKLKGRFPKPDIEKLTIGIRNAGVDQPQWDKAFLSLGITDMKGIKDSIRFQVNGATLPVNPGIPTGELFAVGVSIPLSLSAGSFSFDCDLNVNGSTELAFVPLGKETNVSLTSPWATPSFTGAFLPDGHTVTDKGFRASWKVLQYNRNFPQQGIGSFFDAPVEGKNQVNTMDATAFGVKLLLPVDEYQKTTRSAKYAVMFIIITFSVFFFVEILNRKRIHPIQYLLVGFAVCLFYLLLLAISEHLSFDLAYLIGAIVVLVLVTFYVRYVFQNTRLTVLFSGVLALLYGFFYSLLQLEDYSLLLGTLGLVLILGIVMYLTRNVNWYRAYEPIRS
ncbi:MAG: cell envelope integrity protein CreD [Rudanella sp.]|nr:cell envelope integrity protein CreD [Rudanella sp.]